MTIWVLKLAISLNPWLELFAAMIPGLVIYTLWTCKIGILERKDLNALRIVLPEGLTLAIKRLI